MEKDTEPTTETPEEEPSDPQPSWAEGNEENLRRREAPPEEE